MNRPLFILSLLLSYSVHSQICFSPPVINRIGINPSDICHADFNGDSSEDIAISNKNGTLSVLTGNGNGTFLSEHEFHNDPVTWSVCAGDFNNDSMTDLATANVGSYTITLLQGLGNGLFNADTQVASITTPHYIISGDFNKDGNEDLAVTNPFKVTILLGNGHGQFTSSDYGSGNSYNGITVADFNGDTVPDLAMAGGVDNAFVMMGTGTGGFGNVSVLQAGQNPIGIVSADFNGDGIPDLATSNSLSDDVAVLINSGNGTFGLPSLVPVGDNPVSITAADFDGDLLTDLAVANNYSGDITVLRNTGSGVFQSALTLNADSFPVSITSADFNNDGKPDLATASSPNNIDSGKADIFLNCSILGIDHGIMSAQFSVYPNPANDEISIQLQADFHVENLMMYDLYGRLVRFNEKNFRNIDISDLAGGIYFLRLKTNKENLYTQFIKK